MSEVADPPVIACGQVNSTMCATAVRVSAPALTTVAAEAAATTGTLTVPVNST